MPRWNNLTIKERATYGLVAPFLALAVALAAGVILSLLHFDQAADTAVICILLPGFALSFYARMLRCPRCDRRVTKSFWLGTWFPPDECPDCAFSFREPDLKA